MKHLPHQDPYFPVIAPDTPFLARRFGRHLAATNNPLHRRRARHVPPTVEMTDPCSRDHQPARCQPIQEVSL